MAIKFLFTKTNTRAQPHLYCIYYICCQTLKISQLFFCHRPKSRQFTLRAFSEQFAYVHPTNDVNLMCIHLTKKSVHYPCFTSRYSQKMYGMRVIKREFRAQPAEMFCAGINSLFLKKKKRNEEKTNAPKPYIGYVYISSIFISLLTTYIRQRYEYNFSLHVVYPFRFTKHISGFAFFHHVFVIYTTAL